MLSEEGSRVFMLESFLIELFCDFDFSRLGEPLNILTSNDS